jgi:hypothetical protein
LHIIENDEDIRVVDPGEESGERSKIRPAGGDNHVATTDQNLPQKKNGY